MVPVTPFGIRNPCLVFVELQLELDAVSGAHRRHNNPQSVTNSETLERFLLFFALVADLGRSSCIQMFDFVQTIGSIRSLPSFNSSFSTPWL